MGTPICGMILIWTIFILISFSHVILLVEEEEYSDVESNEDIQSNNIPVDSNIGMGKRNVENYDARLMKRTGTIPNKFLDSNFDKQEMRSNDDYHSNPMKREDANYDVRLMKRSGKNYDKRLMKRKVVNYSALHNNINPSFEAVPTLKEIAFYDDRL